MLITYNFYLLNFNKSNNNFYKNKIIINFFFLNLLTLSNCILVKIF